MKWTWDRKFNLRGQGIFQTSVLGLKSPDQIKVEGPMAISFNLDKPSPILLKQRCNLAVRLSPVNLIYFAIDPRISH